MQFEGIVRAHESFVTGRQGGARAILRMVSARNMVCHRRRLADSDFTGADLSGGSYIGSDLSRAALFCANLQGCDIRSALLVRADLRGASLAGAKLAGSDLTEADLRAAKLAANDEILGLRWVGASSAGFQGTRLDCANLSEADAYSVDFSDCSLRGAKLRSANLKNANFSDADLGGADLTGARLEGVRLRGANLSGIDVAKLNLPADAVAGCVVDPTPAARAAVADIVAAIEGAERWVQSGGSEGTPANLDGMDLRPATAAFQGKLLAGLSARRTLGLGLDFSGAQLQGANFEGADLRGANFSAADLRGASFRNAKLAHAQFRDADLGDLPLRSGARRPVNLEGASLAGTGLAQASRPDQPAQLRSASWTIG